VTKTDSAAQQSPPELRGHQKKYLRKLAHSLKPLVHVGEAGVSEAVIGALDDALGAHELVKVRLRQPDDKKAAAARLAETVHAGLCGVVGHTVILYRPNPDDPKIDLPTRRSS